MGGFWTDGDESLTENGKTNKVVVAVKKETIKPFHVRNGRSSEDDQKLKAKLKHAELEFMKKTEGRSEVIDKLKKLRGDRAQKISSLKLLNGENNHFRVLLDEKRNQRETLHKALGRLDGKGEYGLCSSKEELNYWLKKLQYRIQHEKIPLSEEKQIMREVKNLEVTRPQVVANAAERAKIVESMGEKDVIERKLQLLKVDMDLTRGHHQTVLAIRKQEVEEKHVIEKKIEAAEVELDALTEKKDKTYQSMVELRKQLGLSPKPQFFKKPILAVEKPETKAGDGVVAAVVVEKEKSEDAKKDKNKAKKVKKAKKAKVAAVKVVDEEDETDFYVLEKKEEVNAEVVDEVKLNEMKREEEIAKAKQALERKKKLAERVAAKAAFQAQKEAEEKQMALEKKKAAVSDVDDEKMEIEAEPEKETVEETKAEPEKETVACKRPESLQKILSRHKEEKNYWKKFYSYGAALFSLQAALGYCFLKLV